MAIDAVKFRKVVRPGDQLRIECEVTQSRTRMARFTGRIYVEGALASEAETKLLGQPLDAQRFHCALLLPYTCSRSFISLLRTACVCGS